ncbi:IPExxxVDY family protein [Flavobacterium sp.]|uniref:IPExxxVDY family protein n=1 Tax=Flavobacterium sp. TaxID=239 RepID=UPI003A92225D
MAIHKLLIDDFVTIDYELIAIHSSLEDYRLAYFINRELSILLEKSPKDIEIRVKEGESCFSRFIYEDEDKEITWNLLENKNTIVSKQQESISLFDAAGFDVSTNVFLLPEFKKVDYIIKIENICGNFAIEELVEKLLKIRHVTTAYKIDHQKLKSKNNLIF